MRKMRVAWDVFLITEMRGGAVYKTCYLSTMLCPCGDSIAEKLAMARAEYPGQNITLTGSHYEPTSAELFGDEPTFLRLPQPKASFEGKTGPGRHFQGR